jgi:FixJ family two-component response regulator
MSDAPKMAKSAERSRSIKPVPTPGIISIVDDDNSFRGAMARLVRSLGHSAMAFDSAEDFLRSGRIEETDCLICDVRMPRMNGIELQQELIAQGHRLPIIFVTGHSTQGARENALAAGAIGFMNKPCDENKLIALLERALLDASKPAD